MTETKRFIKEVIDTDLLYSVKIKDNGVELTDDEIVDLLNEQEEKITALTSILWNTNMANTRLKEQIKAISKELNYIQNSITDKIKHQKTKMGEKALKEVIEDYNEWILGHKEIVK